ncbi:actin-related protein 8-like isoform X2 [Elaeis guineensis]|uniref:actin-related protein 8-like isoform X2 n=1 Tax=Elaeis guineensis var. tenera TaxID=51953 RepID=UPI003C6CDB45
MYARLRHFFLTIYNRMQVKPSSQPIIVSIPICHSDDTESARASRRQLMETIYSVLFDMNAPAVCAIDQDLPLKL